MQYRAIRPAVFLSRPNRFVAQVKQDGQLVTAHVKNTGRCAELLVPGARVYLEYSQNASRRTPCDLVAVEKETPAGPLLINMDSAAPNMAAKEWLQAGGLGKLSQLRAEYQLGNSRFDFYANSEAGRMLVEVKGCTLEQDGVALFPDAPTLRGVKHLKELATLAAEGWQCCLLVVIQMKGPRLFRPNWATHPAFGEAMREAALAHVQLYAMDCLVTPDSMKLDAPVPIDLSTGDGKSFVV